VTKFFTTMTRNKKSGEASTRTGMTRKKKVRREGRRASSPPQFSMLQLVQHANQTVQSFLPLRMSPHEDSKGWLPDHVAEKLLIDTKRRAGRSLIESEDESFDDFREADGRELGLSEDRKVFISCGLGR